MAFVVIILIAIQLAKFGDWIVRAGHFAERHGLIIIIALGEIVVAIGISVVDSLDEETGLTNETVWGLIAAGIMASLLWWCYFDRVQPALEHRDEVGSVADTTHMPDSLGTELAFVGPPGDPNSARKPTNSHKNSTQSSEPDPVS